MYKPGFQSSEFAGGIGLGYLLYRQLEVETNQYVRVVLILCMTAIGMWYMSHRTNIKAEAISAREITPLDGGPGGVFADNNSHVETNGKDGPS